MFPKAKRLTTDAFDSVFKEGKSIHSPFFHIKYVQRADTRRFAVAISKKVLPGAFKRHSLKRRIMAGLRAREAEFSTGDFILFPKKEVLTLEKQALYDAIYEIMQKVV